MFHFTTDNSEPTEILTTLSAMLREKRIAVGQITLINSLDMHRW